MNIAVEAELRLVELIREARTLIEDLKKEKTFINQKIDSLPPAEKDYRAQLKLQMGKITQKCNALINQISSASASLDKFHGNLKWKNAVLQVYGEEGINACIAFFHNQRAAA